MSTVLGADGRVTIEKSVRDQLGVKPGWRAVQSVRDGALVVKFEPPKNGASLAGILSSKTTVRILDNEAMEEAIDFAWGEHVREKYGYLVGSPES